MDIIYDCCAGLDLHLKSIQAHVRRRAEGGAVTAASRKFATTAAAILSLGDWLAEYGIQKVAMEATDVYWKPVWNLLEERFSLMLVNAQHFHNVPGRKTDAGDAEWLAQLLQGGLRRDGFVPPRPQRELRDLTRQRICLVDDQSRVVNRIQKTLEDANIKLSSVASDVMGASGRDMLRAIIGGQEDSTVLAELARRRMRAKIPELREALRGGVRDHHRFLLKQLMAQVEMLESQIALFESRIAQLMDEDQGTIDRLTDIPGVDQRVARIVVAEIGTDMTRFPTADHLCSWAGVCPGNHESAGKRKSGRTPGGNRWLCRTLVQAAWAGSHTKNSYFQAQHRRIARRRGFKRATMAVARSILVVTYHMLKTGTVFKEAGAAFFDGIKPERAVKDLLKRLETLGCDATITTSAA